MFKLSKFIFVVLLCSQIISCCDSTPIDDIIIPRPASVVAGCGNLKIGNEISVQSVGADGVSEYLVGVMAERFNIIASQGASKSILLSVDVDCDIVEQGYSLVINRGGVEVVGSTSEGVFYGVQSLLQLMEAGRSEGDIRVRSQTINDAPRFGWRSYMLDESRHFFGQDEVYRLLDNMAELKLNVFHWHLTDDAGWRIESKKYPLLTEVGSKRKDTQVGGWHSDSTSGVTHEGFYTQDQIRDIVAYAKVRNIKVIPEIEMPGHASASMAAYPWLGTKNKKIEVPVKFGKHYHTYNVIDPRVQQFLKDIIVETIELFDTDVIHIGGDEVRFNHWEEDKKMVAYKKKMGFASFMDVQIEFSNNMSRFIEEQGCSMMGWNEILGKNLHSDDNISFDDASTKIAPNVVVQFWKGDINELANAAKQGYKLVNSYHEATYLDYSYEKIPLKVAYDFDPIPEGLDAEYHDNIIGFGCQMWTEWAPTATHIQKQTFPRIAAYSEVGWSAKEEKNYENFLSRLAPMVERWRAAGVEVYPYDEVVVEK